MSDHENEVDDGKGPRAVITLSGIPHEKDPVRMLRVLDDITEAVGNQMDNMEVGLTLNTPDETFLGNVGEHWLQEHMKDRIVDGVDANLHMKSLVAAQLVVTRSFSLEDENAENAWESKSEEEKDAIIAHNKARNKHYEDLAVKELTDKRTNEIRQAFDVANTWAAEPNLTPMERCHGVAHDLYSIYGVDKKAMRLGETKDYIPPSHQTAFPVSAGAAYANHYDTQLADKIKARSIKAAKELFGGK